MNFPDESAGESLQLFEPAPDAIYSVETVAEMVSLPQRTILLYCEQGLISPVPGGSQGTYVFDDEAIRALQQIERLRSFCRDNLDAVQMMLELMREVEQLREELRFRR